MPSSASRLVIAGITGVVLAAGAVVPAAAATPRIGTPASAGPSAFAKKPATTSAKERKRVDSVKTPKLGWYKCYGTAECATVRLPLDYDKPKGATTEIAVRRSHPSELTEALRLALDEDAVTPIPGLEQTT